jgi:mono/diheme cytochrome c family protein
MTRRSTPLLSAVAAVFALYFVLGITNRTNDAMAQPDHLHHHHYAEFAKVPEKARVRRNPLESDPDAVAAGRKLFERHCAECHGNTAQGGKKAPSLRAEEVQQATDGTIFWVLTNGVVRRGMPVWSKLPEPERWQIVTFLKSLKPSPAGAAPAADDRTP